MSGSNDSHLNNLLARAKAASAAERINYRDPIAEHGSRAIRALEPWLTNRRLATFAVLTIGRAGEHDRALAAEVLRRSLGTVESPVTKSDIAAELARLGVRPDSAGRRRAAHQAPEAHRPIQLRDLVVGELYGRSHLHASGLGGNLQSGISYPAGGDYALLFSNPARENETGYHDRWDGPDRISFYGRWDGDGDMRLEGANQRFIDLSPNLHLFVLDGTLYRYEGRFRYVGHRREPTRRGRVPAMAIVFTLERLR